MYRSLGRARRLHQLRADRDEVRLDDFNTNKY